MEYATLYIMDPSLVGSKVLDTIPQIKSYSSKKDADKATGMIIKLDEVKIEMNFMESEKLSDHLEGFKGLAYNYVNEGVDPIYVLTRIFYVRLAIGCVIEPTSNKSENILEFFKNFNRAYNSLLFYNDKVFDYDMEVLVKLH